MNAQPLTGIKTIPGNYASIQNAIDSLNTYGVGTGGVNFQIAAGQVFNLTSNTFALKITTSGTIANPIVFEKSGPGENPLLNITGGSGTTDAGIWLNSADYITFNGIDIKDAGSSTSNYLEYGFYLSGSSTDGCSHNTFKNLSISLTQSNTSAYCIYSVSSATVASGKNSSNIIQNVTMKRAIRGIYFIGVTGLEDEGNTVQNVLIDSLGISASSAGQAITMSYQDGASILNTVASNLTGNGIYGINMSNSMNFTIQGDTLRNLTNGSSAAVYCIYFTNSSGNNLIKGNVIQNVSSNGGGINCIFRQLGTSTNQITENTIFNIVGNFVSGQLFGILARDGTAIDYIHKNTIYNFTSAGNIGAIATLYTSVTTNTEIIYNNFVYDLKGPATSSTYIIAGFYFMGGTIKLYYNTAYINYTSTSSTNTSAALYISPVNGATLEAINNILINTSNVSTGLRAVAFWWVGTSLTNLNTTTNNNLLYAGTPSTKNLIYYNGTNSDQTLANYKTRVSPREIAAVTEMPPFMSIAPPYNLHINSTINTLAESGGQPINSYLITTDIDGDIRWGNTGYYGNGTDPDIGADEFSLVKTDAGITAFAPSIDTICSGNKPISVILKNFGPQVLTSSKINWVVNGVQQAIMNWSGVLLANASTNVTIGNYDFIAGNVYTIQVYSSFPNYSTDTFPSNDTIFKAGIYVKQSPSITPVTSSYSICAGDSVQLQGTITGGSPFTIVVTNGSTNLTFTGLNSVNFANYVNPSSTSAYSFYSVTDNTGCSSSNTTVMLVTVNPLPAANSGGNISICSGISTTLGTTAVSGNTYLWSPSSGLNNNTVSNPIVTPASTTIYTLTETITNTSCFKQNQVIVTVNTKPVPNAGSNQTIASGGTTTLLGSASGGSGFYLYHWKPAALFINPTIAHPTTNALTISTVFTLIVTDSLTGCIDSASTTVLISGGILNSNVSATPAAICLGTQTQLLALASGGSGNYNYNWSSVPSGFSGNASNPIVSPLVTTKYFVTINDGTNNQLDSVLITVYPNPTAAITPATSATFCQSGSVVLNANTGTGLSYKWYKDNVLQTPQSSYYTAAIGGSYVVVITNGNNCTVSSSAVIVTVNPNPTASFTIGGSSTICLNDSVLCTTNAGIGYTYQWMLNASPINGAINQTYYAKQSGLLSVVVSNSYPCSTTSSAQTITVVNPPTASITPLGPTNFCFGSSCTLSATSGTGYSYVWLKNGGVINDSVGSTFTATTDGLYRVKVINSSGCFDTSAVLVITTIAAPVANINASGNTTFCQPDSVLLTSTTGTGYLYTWKLNGITIPGASASTYYAKTTGSYKVVISNTSCTTTSNAIAVIAYALPVAIVAPSGTVSFCLGDSVFLSTSNGSGYSHQWFRNNIAINGATSSYIFIKTVGSYHVVISVGGGACSATSAQVIATINTISATIAYTASPYCNNITSAQNVSLTGTSGGTFSSSSGLSMNATTGAIIPSSSSAGTYTVTYTIAPSGGCVGFSTSTSVTIISLPAAAGTITSNHNDTVNVGETNAVYKVPPIANATTYIWSYSGSGATFVPSATTTVDSVKINFAGNATSGNLTVKGQNSCGDGSISAVYPINISTVGINENFNAINCQIYPNPTSGLITVTINGISGSMDLQIIDIVGKLIYGEKLTLKNQAIIKNLDLSAYPKDIYLIKLSNKNTSKVEKLIIK